MCLFCHITFAVGKCAKVVWGKYKKRFKCWSFLSKWKHVIIVTIQCTVCTAVIWHFTSIRSKSFPSKFVSKRKLHFCLSRFAAALQEAAQVDKLIEEETGGEEVLEDRLPLLGVPLSVKESYALQGNFQKFNLPSAAWNLTLYCGYLHQVTSVLLSIWYC